MWVYFLSDTTFSTFPLETEGLEVDGASESPLAVVKQQYHHCDSVFWLDEKVVLAEYDQSSESYF